MFNEICENLRSINRAISEIEQELKYYISTENEYKVDTYTKIYSYLVTCWTEVRVLKLANEKFAFTQDESNKIIQASTLESKWTTALNIGFCKAFGFQDINLKANYMDSSEIAQYDKLLSLIQNQLKTAITIRNKITHGQWVHTLNNKNTALNEQIKTLMNQENYLLIRLRSNIFSSLSQLIHDLCVSGETFRRDYNKNINQINQYFDVYEKQGYESFKRKMVDKYKRGQLKKVENLKRGLEQ